MEDEEDSLIELHGEGNLLDMDRMSKRLAQMYKELDESYLERKSTKLRTSGIGKKFKPFNIAEEYEEMYSELNKWENNCKELIDISKCMMDKIKIQSDSLFVHQMTNKKIQEELVETEKERAKYKIDLKAKNRELEYAKEEFNKQEHQKTRLMNEHLKLSTNLENLTHYYSNADLQLGLDKNSSVEDIVNKMKGKITRLEGEKSKLYKEIEEKKRENQLLKDKAEDARGILREHKIETQKAGYEQKGLKERINLMKISIETKDLEMSKMKEQAMQNEKDLESVRKQHKSQRSMQMFGVSPSHKYYKSMDNNFNQFFTRSGLELQSEPTVKATKLFISPEEHQTFPIAESDEFNQSIRASFFDQGDNYVTRSGSIYENLGDQLEESGGKGKRLAANKSEYEFKPKESPSPIVFFGSPSPNEISSSDRNPSITAFNPGISTKSRGHRKNIHSWDINNVEKELSPNLSPFPTPPEPTSSQIAIPHSQDITFNPMINQKGESDEDIKSVISLNLKEEMDIHTQTLPVLTQEIGVDPIPEILQFTHHQFTPSTPYTHKFDIAVQVDIKTQNEREMESIGALCAGIETEKNIDRRKGIENTIQNLKVMDIELPRKGHHRREFSVMSTNTEDMYMKELNIIPPNWIKKSPKRIEYEEFEGEKIIPVTKYEEIKEGTKRRLQHRRVNTEIFSRKGGLEVDQCFSGGGEEKEENIYIIQEGGSPKRRSLSSVNITEPIKEEEKEESQISTNYKNQLIFDNMDKDKLEGRRSRKGSFNWVRKSPQEEFFYLLVLCFKCNHQSMDQVLQTETKILYQKVLKSKLQVYKWPRWVNNEMGRIYLESLMETKITRREAKLLRDRQLMRDHLEASYTDVFVISSAHFNQ